jgi:6-phosphogluconolactonase (cycloisomerase 2 family)
MLPLGLNFAAGLQRQERHGRNRSTSEWQVYVWSNRGHDSIAVFAIGPKGTLKAVEYISTEGKTPRSFAIDPASSYLFAADQGSNKIVVFRIDSQTGHR